MRASIPLLFALSAGVVACSGPPEDPVAPGELISRARRLDLDGRHAEAVALFREALEHEPDSFDANYGLARALDMTDDYDEARAYFTRAIELADAGAKDQAERMLGVSWTFSRNLDEAARAFGEVYERRLASGNFAGASEVANELGRVYLELGDLDQAEAWYRTGYETAARENGRTDSAVDLADLRWAHARARLAARRGQAAEARRQIAAVKRLVDKGGNTDQEIQYAYLVGYVELHLGNAAAALQALTNADQDDPFVLLLEAQASEALGRTDAVRGFAERVLASPSHAVTAAIARPIARAMLDGLH